MALNIYLLQKSEANLKPTVNGCVQMLACIDNTAHGTAASRLAAAIALAETAMGVTLDAAYFDVTERDLGVATSSYLPADNDNIVFTDFQSIETIA